MTARSVTMPCVCSARRAAKRIATLHSGDLSTTTMNLRRRGAAESGMAYFAMTGSDPTISAKRRLSRHEADNLSHLFQDREGDRLGALGSVHQQLVDIRGVRHQPFHLVAN